MCDCIETVNAELARHNTCISVPLMGPARPFVTTTKVDERRRGRPTLMFATFCPFCGTKYEDATDALSSPLAAE
jgi:hypothetical protein